MFELEMLPWLRKSFFHWYTLKLIWNLVLSGLNLIFRHVLKFKHLDNPWGDCTTCTWHHLAKLSPIAFPLWGLLPLRQVQNQVQSIKLTNKKNTNTHEEKCNQLQQTPIKKAVIKKHLSRSDELHRHLLTLSSCFSSSSSSKSRSYSSLSCITE